MMGSTLNGFRQNSGVSGELKCQRTPLRPMKLGWGTTGAAVLRVQGGFPQCRQWLIRKAQSTACFGELLIQLGQNLKKIADETVIRDLKDWRFFVLVDCNDDFGVLHTCQVLDRA
jgi:hypothetical protein